MGLKISVMRYVWLLTHRAWIGIVTIRIYFFPFLYMNQYPSQSLDFDVPFENASICTW